MQTQLFISGMTCGSCVEKVQKTISGMDGVNRVHVDLNEKRATIDHIGGLDRSNVERVIRRVGNYGVVDEKPTSDLSPLPTIGKKVELPSKSFQTYKPLILIVGFIVLVSSLAQYPFEAFSWMTWMRHFMAGFFLVFSFFKLLNISGFANSYAKYDLLAARWKAWGYLYPFVELLLGISYLINFDPVLTNWLTLVILGFSSIGVIKSNLDKRKIKCACLGDVFNLPMSTVTVVEDLTMVAMAGWMLFIL